MPYGLAHAGQRVEVSNLTVPKKLENFQDPLPEKGGGFFAATAKQRRAAAGLGE